MSYGSGHVKVTAIWMSTLFILVWLLVACNNPENAHKKIDIDSLKGQLPTAPVTPPDTAKQFDTLHMENK